MSKKKLPITLLDLVTQRPDSSLKIDEFICPFCKSNDIKKLGSQTTLVWGPEGTDPNHVWTHCQCKKCSEFFIHEHKSNNTWYTQNQKVILGIPSCFEDYIYRCKHCGGYVYRFEIDKKTNKKAKVLIYDCKTGEPSYKTVYRCVDCNSEVESAIDYWHPGWENGFTYKGTKRKWRRNLKLKVGWTIKEEVGIVNLNTNAIKKIQVGT